MASADETYGRIIPIKKVGADGTAFDIREDELTFGRAIECDIRVQQAHVEGLHAVLTVDENQQVALKNMSDQNPTCINGKPLTAGVAFALKHGDLFSIATKRFRFEMHSEPKNEMYISSPTKSGTPLSVKNQTVTTPKSVVKSPKKYSSPAGLPITPVLPNGQPANPSSRRSSGVFLPTGAVGPFDAAPTHVMPAKSLTAKGAPTPQGTPGVCGKSTATSPTTPLMPMPVPTTTPGRSALRRSVSKPERRRSVRFAGPLSPELIDKTLPPCTPVKLGRTPEGRRRSMPGFIGHDFAPTVTTNKRRSHGIYQLPVVQDDQQANSDASAVHKQLPSPLRREIAQGKSLSSTKPPKVLCTPLRRDIAKGTSLQPTMKKVHTPLRNEIARGTSLKATMPKMKTPLRKEIAHGTSLKPTMPKMKTPLRKEIAHGTALKATMPKMKTPLRKEIAHGTALKPTMKKVHTPLRKAITLGVTLKPTMRKMGTPLRAEIVQGTTLRATKRIMKTPLRRDITQGAKLKPTKRKMSAAMQEEIVARANSRAQPVMHKLATPLRKEIEQGPPPLRSTVHKMKTPLRRAIAKGMTLRATRRKMATPLRKDIAQGKTLRPTKRKTGTPRRKSARMSDSPLNGVAHLMKTPRERRQAGSTTPLSGVQRVMKTPKRKNLVSDSPLMALPHLMKTPRAQRSQVSDSPLAGVQHVMKTPRTQKAPVSDSPLDGVVHLMKTPRAQRPHLSDSPLAGVQHVMKTPRTRKAPVSDSPLEGVVHLMKTPRAQRSQVSDSPLAGVQHVMKTPRTQKAPVSDSPLDGIVHLMKTPRSRKASSDTPLQGVAALMKEPRQPVNISESPLSAIAPLFTSPIKRRAPEPGASCPPPKRGRRKPSQDEQPASVERQPVKKQSGSASPAKELAGRTTRAQRSTRKGKTTELAVEKPLPTLKRGGRKGAQKLSPIREEVLSTKRSSRRMKAASPQPPTKCSKAKVTSEELKPATRRGLRKTAEVVTEPAMAPVEVAVPVQRSSRTRKATTEPAEPSMEPVTRRSKRKAEDQLPETAAPARKSARAKSASPVNRRTAPRLSRSAAAKAAVVPSASPKPEKSAPKMSTAAEGRGKVPAAAAKKPSTTAKGRRRAAAATSSPKKASPAMPSTRSRRAITLPAAATTKKSAKASPSKKAKSAPAKKAKAAAAQPKASLRRSSRRK